MMTRTEERAAHAVEELLATRRVGLEDLVDQLVAINSQIPPDGDERAIVRFLTQIADELHLPSAEVTALDPERPNLIIRIHGVADGPRLILNGHVDTKPVGDAASLWRTDPFVATRVGDRTYGLGVADMKAAVGAMMYAAAAIRDCGIQLHGDLLLALVADEEAGGAYGSRYVAPLLAVVTREVVDGVAA